MSDALGSPDDVEVLVTGASGFIGSALSRALEGRGVTVRSMTRRPDAYSGAGRAVFGDIDDGRSLGPALAGVDAAYYLVHSLASPDFAKRDRYGSRAFATAAADAGVSQVIYLGGLGDAADDLSPHLRSRREVEAVLAAEVPTTVLRAGIVIGDGGISWEILAQLVERLPLMITPRWVDTRCQPVGVADTVRALCGLLGSHEAISQTFDIGGRDVLTYREMLSTVATMTARRKLILPVPFLSPRLSSRWLRLITDVDLITARALVDSLSNEVVARDDRIWKMLDMRPAGFADAAADALRERGARRGGTLNHVAP